MTQMVIPSHPLIITAPQGASELPLVELDKTKIKTKHQRVVLPKAQRQQADCSYGEFGDTLRFSAWELHHAAKKTELTRTFTQRRADELGLLFAHEHHERFIWNTQNLRCVDGSGLWLEDFSSTGLAGRIGEALAYLTMVRQWGYVYWDRIASVWMRAEALSRGRGNPVDHDEMLRIARYTGQLNGNFQTLQPDFVFERADRTTALMEAKGSFVTPGNPRPNVKNVLKHGLEQLDAWASLIAPAPSNSIAIGSFLREASDSCSDPSLILHVDPPPTERPDIEPINLPRDEIRRGNYGAWVAAMGFRQSGSALTDRRQVETTAIELPVVTLNGRQFALSIQGWRVDRQRFANFPWWPFELTHLRWRHRLDFLRDVGITGVYATGMEVSTLLAASAAVADPASEALMNLQPTTDFNFGQVQQADGFYGSVMPDGSLVGIITAPQLETIREETFNL